MFKQLYVLKHQPFSAGYFEEIKVNKYQLHLSFLHVHGKFINILDESNPLREIKAEKIPNQKKYIKKLKTKIEEFFPFLQMLLESHPSNIKGKDNGL